MQRPADAGLFFFCGVQASCTPSHSRCSHATPDSKGAASARYLASCSSSSAACASANAPLMRDAPLMRWARLATSRKCPAAAAEARSATLPRMLSTKVRTTERISVASLPNSASSTLASQTTGWPGAGRGAMLRDLWRWVQALAKWRARSARNSANWNGLVT